MSDEACSNSSQQQIRVPFFRPKKAAANASIRRRNDEDEEKIVEHLNQELDGPNDADSNSSADESSDEISDSRESTEKVMSKLVEKRRRLRGRNLIQTTCKKRRKELDELADDDTSEEEDETAAKSKFDPDVKFASSGAGRIGPADMGATARVEIDTDYTRDSQAQFERVQGILRKERQEREAQLAIEEEERKIYGERPKQLRDAQEAGTSKPKIYRGMAMYGAKEKEDTIKGNASSGLNRVGPIRATQYMRANVRWDYAPDICKDYKETGYCTFGDSCKFMHDRTDYKHGWEIERDWQDGKLKEAKDDEYLVSSEEECGQEEDKLPHSCFICRQHFRQPVVTKCKHYFCEECALQHYQKSKKCAACGQKTDGVFNVAREVLTKMKARDDAKTRQEQEGIESDGGEDQKPSADQQQTELKTLPMAMEGERPSHPDDIDGSSGHNSEADADDLTG